MEKEWNVCRICLKEAHELCSIYDEIDCEPPEPEPVTIANRIMSCSSITITTNDNLPAEICVNCLDDLQATHRFHYNCVSSEAVLRSIEQTIAIDDDDDDDEDDNNDIESLNDDVDQQTTTDQMDCIKEEEEHVQHTPISNDLPYIEEEAEDENLDLISVEEIHETDNLNESIDMNDISELWNQNDESSNQDEDDVTEVNDTQYHVMHVRAVRTNKARQKQPMDGTGNDSSTLKPKSMKVCVICGNEYKFQHTLNSHIRRHRNEKPFKCEVCGKGFVIAFDLSRHMRTHTGKKPYPCSHCGRAFSDFSSRSKHERTHTGERPYSCEICQKTFSYSHVLSNHMATHTGEKRFKCQKCDRRFIKSHHLKSHMMTHEKHEKLALIKDTNNDHDDAAANLPIIDESVSMVDGGGTVNCEEEFITSSNIIVYNDLILANDVRNEFIIPIEQSSI